MKTPINSTQGDDLLRFELDEIVYQTIQRALGDLKGQSRKVLKAVVNDTAKQARTDLANKTKEVYTGKKGPVTKAMDIRKATVSNPTATINVTSAQLELRDFRTRSSAQSGVAAKVKAKGPMKAVQSKRAHKAKAFIVTFESGHKTIAQRQEGETYKQDAGKRRAKYGPHADITRLKKMLSVSIPAMVGNQAEVYGVVEPKIYAHLLDSIQKEVNKVLSKKK